MQPHHRHARTTIVRTAALVGLALATLAGAGCSKGSAAAKGSTMLHTPGGPVHAIERGPETASLTVLFLHGQSYSSRIWDDRGTLDAVAAKGYRAVAIDLPGFGDTPKLKINGTGSTPGSVISNPVWMRAVVNSLGGPARVVLVSPSMSGAYSLSYLSQYIADPLAGFVPVAPVGTDAFTRAPGGAPIPSLVVYGSKDPAYTAARAQHLLDVLGSKATGSIDVIKGAGHACYDDHPTQFNAALLKFLGVLGR